MEHARLGRTDLEVSRIALGCMSYGDPVTGLHQWTLDEEASQPFFRQAVELGVTFWDTANVYQAGSSEEFVGRAIKKYARREDIMLATKVFGKMHDGTDGQGLSRGAILEQVDASLRRLGTDYIDVYYIHRFDTDVPVEETMEALHDIVRAGKVRYLGASSMFAWQFAKLQPRPPSADGRRSSAMEDQYNLLKREEEREMIPMCARHGRRLDPVLAPGQGAPHPTLGTADRARRRCRRQDVRLPADGPIVDVVEQIAGERETAHGADRVGLGAPQPGRRRADRRRDRSRSTSPTPSRPSTSTSPTTRLPAGSALRPAGSVLVLGLVSRRGR